MLEFTNSNEMARADFDKMVSVYNLEVHHEKPIQVLYKSIADDLEKAEAGELDEEKEAKVDLVKSELDSFQKIVVVNDNLSKSIYYVREAQVEFSGDVERDEEGVITKAEKGIYLDTPLNRALERVGEEYEPETTA